MYECISGTERARQGESTTFYERAKRVENTKWVKRAKTSESAMARERAIFPESAIDLERVLINDQEGDSMEDRRMVTCPFCNNTDARRRFGWFAKPEGREHEFGTVLHCPACSVYFSPLPLRESLDREVVACHNRI